MVAIIGNLEV